MRTCCTDCKKRHIGCHSECEEYTKYREQRLMINEKKRNECEVNQMHYESLTRHFTRNRNTVLKKMKVAE